MSFAILDDFSRAAPEPAESAPISYGNAVQGWMAQGAVHLIERLGGRDTLMRRAASVVRAPGRDPYAQFMQVFGLRLDIQRGALGMIPAQGPLVLVANHPFGILDGLVMGYILSGLRRDFRLIAHRIVADSPLVGHQVLPIDFDATRAAQETTLATRAEAVRFLRSGGAVGIFPGGTVSTAPRALSGKPLDPVWRGFTARMIQKSGATVVPLWFDGQNSRLFQAASHVSTAARLGLLVREFATRVDQPVRLSVGQPIGPDIINSLGTAKEVMDFLRRKTYEMSTDPSDAGRYGHEFEAHHKRQDDSDGSGRVRFGTGRADRS